MPKVSVIIPIYGVEKYLRQCVDSVLTQTLKDIEIILVDDGSKDKCPEIVDEYAKKDPRVIAIHQANQTVAVARNNGFSKATGEYVIWFDSDDYMDPSYLEKMYRVAQETKADIVYCRHFFCFLDGTKNFEKHTSGYSDSGTGLKLFHKEQVRDYVFQYFSGCPWDKIYNRDFLLKHHLKYTPRKHTEDLAHCKASYACADTIAVIDDCLVYHRKRNTSLEANRFKEPSAFYEALSDLKHYLQERGLFELYERSYNNFVVSFLYGNSRESNCKCKKQIRQYAKCFITKSYPPEYWYNYDKMMELFHCKSRCLKKMKKILSGTICLFLFKKTWRRALRQKMGIKNYEGKTK